jgi:hypothetical protein
LLTTPETFDADIESSRLSSKCERLNGRLNRNRADRLEETIEKTPSLFEVETKAQQQGQISQLLFQLDEHSNKIGFPVRSDRNQQRVAPVVPFAAPNQVPAEVVATVVEDNVSRASDEFKDLRIAQIEEELRQLRGKRVASEILQSPVQLSTSSYSYNQPVSHSVPQSRTTPHHRSRRAGRRIQERRSVASLKYNPDIYIPRLIQAVTHLASIAVVTSLLAEQPVCDLDRLSRILEGKEGDVYSIADIAGQIERHFPGY